MPLEAAIKVVHFPKNKCLRLRFKKKNTKTQPSHPLILLLYKSDNSTISIHRENLVF